MIDHRNLSDSESINNLTPPEMEIFLNETLSKLKGSERRKFMANVVCLMGKGGQRRAERELGWDRKTIEKGTKELDSGFDCVDNFSGRGRHSIEQKLPDLLKDINESYLYFTDGHATADFMVDCLEDLWPIIKTRF